jgi:hypothetical protein
VPKKNKSATDGDDEEDGGDAADDSEQPGDAE